ncbi:MAG TPA: response regulator transcription factor [Rectinemataceae bacterium]|nr:response regulator transcription factor [Rectinemataceae bacterium]
MSQTAEGRLVLLVEDDSSIAELVAAYLRRDGHRVVHAASAEAALSLMGEAPELVLLDLGLPGMDGLEFLRAFRTSSLAPVIIVSARESDEDKLEGLGLGADDFITKPFSPRVLAARVSALLRRVEYESMAREDSTLGAARTQGAGPAPKAAFGAYVLDPDAGILTLEGHPVQLSRREFELLSYLVLHPGRSFSAAELHREVWGLEHGDLSTVAVHIQRIRRKIETEVSKPRWIRTVPGAGYRFVPSDEDSGGAAALGKDG